MISVMSANLEYPSDRKDDVVGEEPTVSLDIDVGNDSSGGLGFYSVESTEEADRVSLANADTLDKTRVCNTMNETMISELNNEETSFGVSRIGALENRPSSSTSKMQGNGKKTDSRNGKSNQKKVRSVVEDYDSMLSAFDEFAAKDKGEAVGYGYEIGDMVWGKVKSHPWWPGQIYNEEYASSSVRRSKREGHVLVAFFGDSSYGWFHPAELIPFEQNFSEKSRQTNLRSFLNAVEEAVDELSRRRNLGLACRCRNEFNFWHSSFEGYFVVDVGEYEPGFYSSGQINKARDNFQPREMLSFIQQLALTPRNHSHGTIEFIKNKATVLACRKSLFEEFDETYAQAFGTVPIRPPRPTAPVSVDPFKAPLSGRLVIAEALGRGGISLKPTKTKDQVEKDKYLFKRRDEPTHKKPKKASADRAGTSSNLLLVDGLGFSGRVLYTGIGDNVLQNYESGATDGQYQPTSHPASIVSDIKSSEGSRKLIDTGTKKVKIHKRPAGKLSSENAILVEKKKKKRKKEISIEASADVLQLPVAVSNSGVAVEKVSGMPLLHVPLIDNYRLDNKKKDGVGGSTSSQVESQQLAVDLGNFELPMLLRDLCALALNPFHGMDRNCPGVVRPFFLKFRSLVYQKSLVSAPTESEASEARSGISLPAATALVGPVDKINDLSTMKAVKPSVRPDDPTKGGRKRGPLDIPEGIKKKKKIDGSEDIKRKKFNDLDDIKKKKINDSEGIKKKKIINDSEDTMKKKINDSEDIKKMKKIDESKLSAAEKRPSQRSVEPQRADVKESATKNAPLTLPKAAKLESSKKSAQPVRAPNPTMLVMKFPSNAGLPSGAELRARFARFGPMDHSATRVFWKSYTCRLVYHYKADAEAALKFVNGSSNLFGNTDVRCHLRDLIAEAAESESAKVQKEDLSSVGTSHFRGSAVEQKTAAAQLVQQSVQLKSCLKKPSSDEGGNGGVRGTRVKFVLGGEESSKNDQVFSGYKNINTNNIASFPEGASSSTHSVDVNSKNFAKFPFHKFPINMMASAEQAPRLFPPQRIMPTAPIKNDISQELLNLLNKCSDVVNNLSGALGYVPYRPL